MLILNNSLFRGLSDHSTGSPKGESWEKRNRKRKDGKNFSEYKCRLKGLPSDPNLHAVHFIETSMIEQNDNDHD